MTQRNITSRMEKLLFAGAVAGWLLVTAGIPSNSEILKDAGLVLNLGCGFTYGYRAGYIGSPKRTNDYKTR